jgi:hypothetical protein
MTALKKMMMKGPPKPPHSAARHQHNGDISRRLDIVPGDAQGSFQPFRPLAADPKPVPAAWRFLLAACSPSIEESHSMTAPRSPNSGSPTAGPPQQPRDRPVTGFTAM